MKKILNMVSLLFLLCLGNIAVPIAYGVASVPFPDSKTLQPIPPSIKPNVSKNINNSGTFDPAAVVSLPNDSNQSVTEENSARETPTMNNLWLGILVFLGLGVAVLVFIRRRRKQYVSAPIE